MRKHGRFKHGCRDGNKRVFLFDFASLEKCSVLFRQETHTQILTIRQTGRRNGREGQADLSHGSNISAGVAVLFSEQFQSQPTNVVELVPGKMKRIDVDFNSFHFSFFNICAPTTGAECIKFFIS